MTWGVGVVRKVAVDVFRRMLKSILCWTGRQCKDLRTGGMWSTFLVFVRTRAAAFWLTFYRPVNAPLQVKSTEDKCMDKFLWILLRHKSSNPWFILQGIVGWYSKCLDMAVQVEVWIHNFWLCLWFLTSVIEAERWLSIIRWCQPLHSRSLEEDLFFNFHSSCSLLPWSFLLVCHPPLK